MNYDKYTACSFDFYGSQKAIGEKAISRKWGPAAECLQGQVQAVSLTVAACLCFHI